MSTQKYATPFSGSYLAHSLRLQHSRETAAPQPPNESHPLLFKLTVQHFIFINKVVFTVHPGPEPRVQSHLLIKPKTDIQNKIPASVKTTVDQKGERENKLHFHMICSNIDDIFNKQ